MDFGRRRLGIRTRLIVSVRDSLPPRHVPPAGALRDPNACRCGGAHRYGATRYDACQYLVRVRTRTRRERAEIFRTKIKMVAKNVGNEMKRSGAWRGDRKQIG